MTHVENRRRLGVRAAVLVGAALLFLIGIDWGLPAYSTWSMDDPTPLGPLKSAYQRFAAFHKYPPVHHALLAAINAPYLGYLYATDQWTDPGTEFPYGFVDPLRALSTLMLLDRLVSVAMALGIVVLVGRATRRIFRSTRAEICAMIVTAGNAHLVLFAHLGNFDVPALFWTSLALVLLLRFLERWTILEALALGAAASLGVSTKEQVYSIFLGFAVWITVIWIRDRRSWKPILAGLISAVVVFVLANNWVFAFDVWLERWRRWNAGVVPFIQVEATIEGQLSLLARFLGYVVSGSGWPVLAWCLIGVVLFARAPRRLGVLIVPLVVYYLATIAPVRFAFPRFALPAVIFLAPIAGAAMAHAWAASRAQAQTVARLLVVGTALFCVGWGARVDVNLLRDSRYEAEAFLIEELPPPAEIEVYSWYRYLPRLEELGYSVTRLDPSRQPVSTFTLAALKERNPTAIVLTANYFPRFTAPELSRYFTMLQGSPPGYKVCRFKGLPHGPELARVSPALWVLVRRDRTEALIGQLRLSSQNCR